MRDEIGNRRAAGCRFHIEAFACQFAGDLQRLEPCTIRDLPVLDGAAGRDESGGDGGIAKSLRDLLAVGGEVVLRLNRRGAVINESGIEGQLRFADAEFCRRKMKRCWVCIKLDADTVRGRVE